MSTFQFDTSGAVVLSEAVHAGFLHYWPGPVTFEQLLPFVQGYVEAAFAEGPKGSCWRTQLALVRMDRIRSTTARDRIVGFSDLAPAALAKAIADCERYRGKTSSSSTGVGALFWKNRAAGFLSGEGWEPLTVSLDDAGKVVFS